MEKYKASISFTEEGSWWLEVVTNEPYLYLFGPFNTTEEANGKRNDYFHDLVSEGWQISSSKMTQAGPEVASR